MLSEISLHLFVFIHTAATVQLYLTEYTPEFLQYNLSYLG